MKNSIIILLITIFNVSIYAQSNSSILNEYSESDEVSKMSLTGDILRMFAKEYEQREIIDKIKSVDVFIFNEKKQISDADLTKIKSNLKEDNYEDLVNARDEGTKIKIMVKEKGETIKRLFMLVEGAEDGQTIVAEMKCELTYDDLRKLQLDFSSAGGLKYLSKGISKNL